MSSWVSNIVTKVIPVIPVAKRQFLSKYAWSNLATLSDADKHLQTLIPKTKVVRSPTNACQKKNVSIEGDISVRTRKAPPCWIVAIKERITTLQGEEAALALEIANLEISKENALTVIGADLSAAAQDRTTTVASVNPELIALYEKIRSANNGTGAAALIGNQCKGCHLTLNTIELQRIAALAEDEIARCEECRCILVRGL